MARSRTSLVIGQCRKCLPKVHSFPEAGANSGPVTRFRVKMKVRTTIRSRLVPTQNLTQSRPRTRVHRADTRIRTQGAATPRAPSNTRGEGQILRVRDAARTCTIGGPFGRGSVRIQTQIRFRRPRKHRGYQLNQYVLDHMYIAGPNQWPVEQGRVEQRRPRVARYTFVPVESRAGSRSARS